MAVKAVEAGNRANYSNSMIMKNDKNYITCLFYSLEFL